MKKLHVLRVAKWLVAALFVSGFAHAATITHLAPLSGVWKSQGQGLLLEISGNQSRLYDFTSISCIQTGEGDGDDFFSAFQSVRLNSDRQQLTLTQLGNVVDTQFIKLTALPDRCANGGMQANSDPELNFEVFWTTFSENYPAFSKRGVDWQQVYQQYRPQVNAQTSDAALFALFGEMIDPLDDGHVDVTNAEDNRIDSFTQDEAVIFRRLDHQFEQQQLINNRQQYIANALETQLGVIQDNYVDGEIKTGVLKQMFWGKTEDNFGYLSLGSFQLDEAENLTVAQMRTRIRVGMAKLIADMKTVKGLMIDLRFNPGGNDLVAFEVASFFNAQSIPVFSVQSAMPGQQLSPAVSADLPVATGARYTGPIALLTSELTGSAAEVFTLAMRELPHVTLVGGNTGGALSNSLEKQLPNGWTFSVAPDVYRSQDGRVFEVEGIPPHAPVEFLSRTDRVLGIDTAINTAQQLLMLDQSVMSSMNNADIPAMSASLVVNGKSIFSKGYGYADVDQQRRATADTAFGQGSVSKTVIGVAIMQLVEQGTLSLDTPINSVLPFVVDNPNIEGEVITIRHLVTHTSSLIDNDDVYDDSYVLEAEAVPALDNFLQNYYMPDGEFYDAQLNFAATTPGQHYEYSNIAATLAAYIVEVVSKQHFDAYVQQHIFQPLQMTNSHYFLSQFPDNRVAIPYGEDNDGQFYHYPTYPEGLLRSSANDLAAYMADLTTQSQLLTQASIASLWTPALPQMSVSNDGVFWDIGSLNGTRLVGHGGSDPGVASELLLLADLGVGAAVSMNADREDSVTDQSNDANQVLISTTQQLLLLGSELATNQFSAHDASGSWYDPGTDGQGLHIEILPDNQAVVIWFGYDAQGQQLWTIGSGHVVGNRIDIPTAYQTTGGVFGANFDPAAVQRTSWGELVFEFEEDGETTATLVYNSLDAQHGEISLTRLTRNYQPELSTQTHNITGTWFDPAHNGEGLILQQLNETQALLYWLTYTTDGEQAWLIGNGQREGDTFNFPEMQIISNEASNNQAQTTQVVRQKWGSISLTITNCQQLDAQYQGLFGDGELMLQRLTTPIDVQCQ